MFKFKIGDEVIIKKPRYHGYFDPKTFEVSTGTVIACNFMRTSSEALVSYKVNLSNGSMANFDESKLALFTDEFKKIAQDTFLYYCPECGEIFGLGKSETYKETSIEHSQCVYSDCGYGDDDVYADIEYSHVYQKCPKCGKGVRIFFNKKELKETRHDKYGNKR